MRLNLYEHEYSYIENNKKMNRFKPLFLWRPTEPQWWITGFNPEYQDVNYKNLRVEGMIDFSREPRLWGQVYNKYAKLRNVKGIEICLDKENKTLYYRW